MIDSSILSEKIFLLDDDLDYCLFLKELAKQSNLNLKFENTIENALDYIKKNDDIDFFIIDGNLPDGLGVDFIRNIKENYKKVPIAFISSEYRDSKSYRFLKEDLQIDFIINKPVTTNIILSLFQKVFNEENIDESDPMVMLRKHYEHTINEKIEKIENLIYKFQDSFSVEDLEKLYMEVHKIAGSSSMYGFYEVGRICKETELKIKENIKSEIIEKNISEFLSKFFENFKLAFQSLETK